MTVEQADQAARDGMAKALRAERVAEWKARAEDWLASVPVGASFSADTLIHYIGLPDESKPGRCNVVGALFSKWAKAGRIEWTGEWEKSARTVGHGNMQRRWRRTSLVESEQGWHRPGPDSTSERVADTPVVAVAPCGARSLAPEQLTLEATA